jgi:hypothetical protein
MAPIYLQVLGTAEPISERTADTAAVAALAAARAGALAALRGQDVGVAGVGVAPGQVVLDPAGQDVWFGWSEPPMTKVRSGLNCASIGLAHDALVGVKHRFTLCFAARARMGGVLFAGSLSKIT